MEAATNTNSSFASRAINVAIGIVLAAILVGGGILAYMYTRPETDIATERSVEQWKQTVQENPNSSLARANLGAAYLDAGMTDEAIQELRIALDQEPKSFTYMEKLGHAYRAKGDLASAVDMFQQSAELTPAGDKAFPLFWAAQSYFEMGDLTAAKDTIQQSIDDHDVNWNSHYLFGQILEKQGDTQGAKAEFEAAAKFNPGNAQIEEALKRVSV